MPSETTPGSSTEGAAPSLERWLPVALLLAAIAVSSFWLIHPFYDPADDGAIYIISTRALLRGEGYTYLGEPMILRPPGFSLLLAPVLAVTGADFRFLNMCLALFGVVGVVLFFFFLQPRVGTALASATALGLWLNPFYIRLTQQAMSDVPGVTLMLGCLLLERWASRRPGSWRDAGLGLAIAAATLVRTVNVFVAPAIVLSRILTVGPRSFFSANRRPEHLRGIAVLCLAVGAGLVPWSLHKARHAPSVPVEHLGAYSYGTGMWHVDPTDPRSEKLAVDEVLGRFPRQAKKLLSTLGSRMQDHRGDTQHRLLGGVATLCWLIVLARRRDTAEWFVAPAIVVLCFFFAFEPRHVLPMFVILLACTVEVGFRIVSSLTGRRVAELLLVAGLLGVAAMDFEAPGKLARASQHQIKVVANFLDTRVPPDVPLAALNGRHLSVFLERPVYNLRSVVRHRGLARLQEVLDERGIGIVVVRRGRVGAKVLTDFLRRKGYRERQVRNHDVFWLRERRAGELAILGELDG